MPDLVIGSRRASPGRALRATGLLVALGATALVVAWFIYRRSVAYDIPDDRRRTKVMNLLYGYGVRVQYSVFECELRPTDLEQLKQRMRRLLQKETDDVRFYSLCQGCLAKVTVMGKAQVHRHEAFVMVS